MCCCCLPRCSIIFVGIWCLVSSDHKHITKKSHLIYKDKCLYVCLYLIQIHISEPIGTKLCTHLPRGLEETVGYIWAHNISPFPHFRPILSWAGADYCAVDDCRSHTTPLRRYIRDAACSGVTSRTVGCAMKTRRSERNACVWKWKPDETGRKWLRIALAITLHLYKW